MTYDGQAGEWVACERCEGSGRVLTFVYPRRSQGRLLECAGCKGRFQGRDLVELNEDNHDNLTYFHGDLLCRKCSGAAGVL